MKDLRDQTVFSLREVVLLVLGLDHTVGSAERSFYFRDGDLEFLGTHVLGHLINRRVDREGLLGSHTRDSDSTLHLEPPTLHPKPSSSLKRIARYNYI